MPVAISTDSPVRERKSVERLVSAVATDSIRKFRLVKGRGLALKDIPNVASQLRKRNADETFKQLHYVLFGRYMKAYKSNLSEFSGFTLHGSEEIHRSKTKEKLEKCVIHKLLEFCDVLDIHVAKRTRTTKDELLAKLLNFLAAPLATTDGVPAKNEKLSSAVKRKRDSDPIMPPTSSRRTTSKRYAGKTRKTVNTVEDVEKKSLHGNEDDSEEDGENENEFLDASASEDEVAEHFRRKDEDTDPKKEAAKPKQGSVPSSVKKEATRKPELKKTLATTQSTTDERMAELLHFLAVPRVTTNVVPAVNEQNRRNTDDTAKDEAKKSSHGKEDDSEEDKENENGVLDAAATSDEVVEHSQREDEDDDPKEEAEAAKQGSAKSSENKEASRKSELKKTLTTTTDSSPKSSLVRTPVASSSNEKHMETAKSKGSAPSEYATDVTTTKEKTGQKLVKGKDPQSKGLNPSEGELRCRISHILHEVDFNTAASVLKQLAAHYNIKLADDEEGGN